MQFVPAAAPCCCGALGAIIALCRRSRVCWEHGSIESSAQGSVGGGRPALWSRAEFLRATLGTLGAAAVVSIARAADNPVVRIAASRGVVSAPIWNVSNHAAQYGFGVQMSVLFTYADQQRAAQNSQTELATTGINNPAIIADQGITDLRYVAGQQFGGQNLILRKNVMADTWKALEGKTIGVVPGTYARVLFLVAAQEGGADLEKIKIVNVSVGATALEALRKGDLDGFVLFAPMTDQVVVRNRLLPAQAGYWRLFFGPGQWWHRGEYGFFGQQDIGAQLHEGLCRQHS